MCFSISTLRALFITCFVAVLAACGGGGGGSPHSSSAPPPVTSALSVQSVSPTAGADNISRSPQVLIDFNQSIKASSVIGGVKLVAANGAAIPFDFNVTNSRITATPKSMLPGAAVYTLTIATTLQSESGQSLQNDYVASFSTRSMSWQGPEEDSNWAASQILVKQNDAGYLVAVFTRYTGNHYGVFSSQNTNGTWSSPQEIDDPTSTGSPDHIALAIDAHGNAMVAWAQSVNSVWGVYAAYYGSGIWSSPVNISSALPGAGNSDLPAIAVDTEGVFTVVWQQAFASSQAILARQYDGSWRSAARIDNPLLSFSWSPVIAATASGDLIAAWRQADGNRTGIYTNRKVSNSAWSLPVEIDDPMADNADTPVISADRNGNVTVAWRQIDPSHTRNVIYANRFSSDVWGAARRIDNSSASVPPATPILASDIAGKVIAVWVQNNGARDEIRSARFENGAWSAPVQLDDPALWNAQSPAITFDLTGNATVAWTQFSGTHHGVFTNRWQLNSWQAPFEISTTDPSNGPTSLNLISNLTGNVEAIWSNNGAAVDFNRLE